MQNKTIKPNYTWCLRGQLTSFHKVRVMGILNTTPDSFYTGSRVPDEVALLKKAEKMVQDGAWMLDVGGYSSRPGATDINEQEELTRILPAISVLRKNFPEVFISIDTYRSKIAQAAIEYGADVINDISGGLLDKNIFNVVIKNKVPYIAMHMRGTPQTMTSQTTYQHVTKDVCYELAQISNQLKDAGIHDYAIDPGFGFAKTTEQNFRLLNDLQYFQLFGKPILAGLSRKSMIWKTLQLSAADALGGTIALNTLAVVKKASILRVHDVAEAVQLVTLLQQAEL
ncbi:MAG: dihydropteroate synthase [Cyclobacteriaceae bacterium]|nr:dihydropteroate synthase [Cyclobacteriaceae bacterium]